MSIVVLYFRDDTHLIAVGIDGTRCGESADVIECHIVDVIARKHGESFQKVHAKKQDDDGYNGREGYFYFLFHLRARIYK